MGAIAVKTMSSRDLWLRQRLKEPDYVPGLRVKNDRSEATVGSPTPWDESRLDYYGGGSKPTDCRVTRKMADAALSAAKQRGLHGLSRVNPSATREQIMAIFEKWIQKTPEDWYIWPCFARRIRQEFGVDGKKRPFSATKRKAESWG